MAKSKPRTKKKLPRLPDTFARLGRGEYIEFVSDDGWADVILTSSNPGFMFSAYKRADADERRDMLRNLAVVKQYLTQLEEWLHAHPAD